MIKRALMAGAAVFIVACNSGPPPGSAQNTVGGADVISATQTPATKESWTLALNLGQKAQAGQTAIADVLTYNGSKLGITAPAGWQLIRDDSTATTRQSIYWHAIQADDPSTATWTFSQPIDAQGAMVLLANAAEGAPVDMTSGTTGTGGTMTAKSIATTADGDLILSFYATDFALPGLMGSFPEMPANTIAVINQQTTEYEYWILQSYQSQNGATEEQICSASQIFNWTAAQVAIKKGTSTATPQ